ncbi:hypothetical protein ACYOEI_04320 [Singulisphaera rosea]
MGVEIEVGGIYTNKNSLFAREILEITDDDVIYRDFVLDDGEPLSSCRKCSRATFRTWAARPCTLEESNRLGKEKKSREDREFTRMVGDLVEVVLSGVSDAELLAEARRRHLIPE